MLRTRIASLFILFAVVLGFGTGVSSFVSPQTERGRFGSERINMGTMLGHSKRQPFKTNENDNKNDDDEDLVTLSVEPMTTKNQASSIDEDLLPPDLIFRRESLLFGDNPSTRKNNGIKDAWVWCVRNLPRVVTGVDATSSSTPTSALACFYNMILVRLPTIAAGFVYVRNLLEGHPLIVDVGNGPFEVSPLIVGAVLWAILR